jgi:hypothetical protein
MESFSISDGKRTMFIQRMPTLEAHTESLMWLWPPTGALWLMHFHDLWNLTVQQWSSIPSIELLEELFLKKRKKEISGTTCRYPN